MRAIYRSALPLLSLITGACATVGPGQAGVLWRATNGTQPNIYGEGLHTVGTLDKMYVYDLRSLTRDEMLSVMASNGLTIKLGATVRYHVVASELIAIQEEVGLSYYTKLIQPLLRSEARRVFSQYTPEEIYSTKRDSIERELLAGVAAKLAGRHLALEAVLIRDVELPAAIRAAIDQKLVTEQQAMKMKYMLAIAKSTADQKQIEAQGIAEYSRTIKPILTHEILEWERIQQMSKLAGSVNAKVVVIGGGTGTTPITVPAH